MRKLVFVLLLLVACQLMQPRTKMPDIPPSVRVGTTSLEIAFNPSSTGSMFMCQPGDVLVELRNTGAFDIENGRYTWIVEDQFLRPLNERQKEFSLKGKDQFNPIGGFDAKTRLRLQSLDLPKGLESYSSPLILQACYPYRTWASVPVCVDPDIRGMNKNKPCKAEPIMLSGGQGAPVAITKVESSMVPLPDGNRVQPMFAVFVQNMGYGQVVAPSDVELACKGGKDSARDKLLPFAEVSVELQDQHLKCTPSPARIETGTETKFVCRRDDLMYDMSTGTFSSVLTVELKYGYVNTAVFPITITRLPNQKSCSE